MCDTFVVLPSRTKNKYPLFGKNSDRDPNEPHQLKRISARDHAKVDWVDCTYIKIPQVSHTHEVYLFKPTWIWGAEMGINEYGVAIGNEAVFSKIKANKDPGLIGMDYLRLGLERASSADEALSIITSLLNEFGQGGNCGFSQPLFYHNSFLIADKDIAWVLETVGHEWIAKKVNDFYAISNVYSIGDEFDLISNGLQSLAKDNNLWDGKQTFNFANIFSDFIYSTFSDGRSRKTCSTNMIVGNHEVTVQDCAMILRSHGGKDNYQISEKVVGSDICMHAGWGPVRANQTTGSMIAEIVPEQLNLFFTGSSNPCLSVFYPYRIGYDHPLFHQELDEISQSNAYWWLKEKVHRKAIFCSFQLINEYREEMFQLEREIFSEFFENIDQKIDPVKVQEFINQSYQHGLENLQRWDKIVSQSFDFRNRGLLFRLAWKDFNKRAKINF